MHVTVLLEGFSPATERAHVPLLLLSSHSRAGVRTSLRTSVKDTREGPRASETLSVGNRTAPPSSPPPPKALQVGLDRIKRGRCVLIASVYRMGLLEEHQELPVGIPRQKGRDKWKKA